MLLEPDMGIVMADPWWQARARGRNGRSKPGRRSRGFFAAISHVKMRDAWDFAHATPDERRRARNKRKAERRKARG